MGELPVPLPNVPQAVSSESRVTLRLALVLWNGSIGGAEMLTMALAGAMRDLGVDVGIVFVGHGEPLARTLREIAMPYSTVGLARGSHVVLHPRRFARIVADVGCDGVILDSIGYQALALRLGGYRGRVVSVEHGALLQLPSQARIRQLARWCERLLGLYASDSCVAVSDFILSKMLRQPRAGRVVRIHNGVNLSSYRLTPDRGDPARYVVGWAGRLVAGKGVDELIRAVALLAGDVRVSLQIAGDGPRRSSLEALANTLGVPERVVFHDWVSDMPGFWQRCDVAAFPPNDSPESFGMGAIEAMASGKPVIVSRCGGLTETVEDGKTGTVVTPGSITELAAALRRYAIDRDLRLEHGLEGRARCEHMFDIRTTAQRYLALYSNR